MLDNRGLPSKEDVIIEEVYLHMLQSHHLIEPLRAQRSEQTSQVGGVVEMEAEPSLKLGHERLEHSPGARVTSGAS